MYFVFFYYIPSQSVSVFKEPVWIFPIFHFHFFCSLKLFQPYRPTYLTKLIAKANETRDKP